MARYRRRRFYRRKNKYNIETNPGQIVPTDWAAPADENAFDRTFNQVVVLPTDTEGVRKVKNLTVDICLQAYYQTSSTATNGIGSGPIYWALVYVPEGTQPNYLNETGDLYQPSQWVLSTGILNLLNGKSRIKTRLAKNLNKGDTIYLCMGTNNPGADRSLPRLSYLCRYAICFN